MNHALEEVKKGEHGEHNAGGLSEKKDISTATEGVQTETPVVERENPVEKKNEDEDNASLVVIPAAAAIIPSIIPNPTASIPEKHTPTSPLAINIPTTSNTSTEQTRSPEIKGNEVARYSPTSPGAPFYLSLGPPISADESNSPTSPIPTGSTTALPLIVTNPNASSRNLIAIPQSGESQALQPTLVQTPAEQYTTNDMGLFSAITGNINAPEKEKNLSRSGTNKTTGTARTTGTAGTAGIGAGSAQASPINQTGDRSITGEPVTQQVGDGENSVAPVGTSVHDRAPTPGPGLLAGETGTTGTRSIAEPSERAISPEPGLRSQTPANDTFVAAAPTTDGGRSSIDGEVRDPVDAPGGIERGVPAEVKEDGHYEATAPGVNGSVAGTSENLVRPSLGDDQPSRSYANRPNSIRNSVRNSVRPETSVLDNVTERAPSVIDREENGQPKNIDYATASPANIGDKQHVGGVISLPAGGALENNQNGNGNAYPYEKEAPRELMNEGQAYRSDGGVPGQPSYQQPPQTQQFAQQPQYQQQQQAAPTHAYAPAAAVGLPAAAGALYNQHQQQQQQSQGQYRQNDPSFAAERAMSPGPADQPPTHGLSRLAIQEPIKTGPSPGPPVNAFSPTSPTSPTRSTGSGNGADLGRNNTYRSTVSRGSTMRRGGAFANGSALQGGGHAENIGRDDIHNRTAAADRALIGTAGGANIGRKISGAEKKDAKRMSKLIVKEAYAEKQAVKGAMKELEALQKVQKGALEVELKAQKKHTKALQIHDKAYRKFLKQKEVYDRIEADLRSREEQYDAARQHSQAQTELLAEKTQELNDLRSQKAADDRERELRLLALKNPGSM